MPPSAQAQPPLSVAAPQSLHFLPCVGLVFPRPGAEGRAWSLSPAVASGGTQKGSSRRSVAQRRKGDDPPSFHGNPAGHLVHLVHLLCPAPSARGAATCSPLPSKPAAPRPPARQGRWWVHMQSGAGRDRERQRGEVWVRREGGGRGEREAWPGGWGFDLPPHLEKRNFVSLCSWGTGWEAGVHAQRQRPRPRWHGWVQTGGRRLQGLRPRRGRGRASPKSAHQRGSGEHCAHLLCGHSGVAMETGPQCSQLWPSPLPHPGQACPTSSAGVPSDSPTRPQVPLGQRWREGPRVTQGFEVPPGDRKA